MRLSSVSALSSCGLLPLADRFHDCGGYERQARETLDVALANTFVSRDLGERVHPAGRQLVKPHPRTRYGFEQCRVYLARWFVTRGDDDPRFHTAALHFEWHEAGQTKNAAGLHSRARTGNPDLECHPYAVVAQFDPVDELDHAVLGIGFVFQSAGKSGGRFNSGSYVGRLEPRPFQHLQHPGPIAQDVLRGNRHRSLELRCSESPAFSVIARGTVNQASRYVVTVPPPRLCRPLSIERLTVRSENLSGQWASRNRAGRGSTATSSIDAHSLLHSLPKLARDDRFVLPWITFLLVTYLSGMNRIRQQLTYKAPREKRHPPD